MKMVARYFSMILITGILLASAGCFFERFHNRHEQHREEINVRVDDHKDRVVPGPRLDRGDRDDRR